MDLLAGGMPSHAAPDHGFIEEVERGEQRGRADALVVMGHRPAFSGLNHLGLPPGASDALHDQVVIVPTGLEGGDHLGVAG
jgi:hypothetical protein